MISTEVSINDVANNAQQAYLQYERVSAKDKAGFLFCISDEILVDEELIVREATRETNLPEGRIKNEIQRTVFQLRAFADLLNRGDWLQPSIDTGDAKRKPLAKPDIRKSYSALGPVVVFGASNFPLAFSTAGGDTASALAAGCSVIVKSHPAHPVTSKVVAAAIARAITLCKMPDNVFQHIENGSIQTGQELVKHPLTKAVAFTGSFQGGKALFDLATSRPEPIPVFAEMGSVNPIVIFPGAYANPDLAETIGTSILLGVGQFCTNPGLIITIQGADALQFYHALRNKINSATGSKMLHRGIAESFRSNKEKITRQPDVNYLAAVGDQGEECVGYPALAIVKSRDFIQNTILREEVFGPFSLVVECSDEADILNVLSSLQGQLTSTIFANENELAGNEELVKQLSKISGRVIFNGVPTGVEVCKAMHHGGPYPATTDSRFTSVGTDAIYRFVRPISFQNFPDHLLPEELQNDNPLGILRCVNNEWSRIKIVPSHHR